MTDRESRLSRWSRLKSRGGADPREEARVVEEKSRIETAEAEADDPFRTLPGGARVRHFVPAMAPLAPSPEDDDDHLTRGVGYADEADEVDEDGAEETVEADGSGVTSGPDGQSSAAAEDGLYDDIKEQDMTEEERELVSSLPPLDSLDKDSDFTPFLRDGVPEFMKRRALRVLWRLNPFFNFRDGLNDYDDDFNVLHKIIDSTFGSYKVGRGHLSEEELQDMMPEEARRAFDPDPEEDAEDAELAEDAESEGEEASGSDPDEVAAESHATAQAGDAEKSSGEAAETVQETAEDELGDGEDDPHH